MKMHLNKVIWITLAGEAILLAATFYIATLYSPVSPDVSPPTIDAGASSAYRTAAQ